jgi:hypothetical protein
LARLDARRYLVRSMDERPLARPAEPPFARSSWLTYAQAAEQLGMTAEAVRHRARRAGWRSMPGNDGRTLILLPDDVAPVRTPGHMRAPDQAAEDVETSARAHGRAERAFTAALSAIREAHAAEVARLTEAKDSEIARLAGQVDALIRQSDGQRAEIVAIEAKLAAETAKAVEARKEVHELANRVMVLRREADRSEAETDALRTDLAVAQADGTTMTIEAKRLRGELQDALAAAQMAQERLATHGRAEAARQARGLLARLRDAWRGE